jgi:hypothetical protein
MVSAFRPSRAIAFATRLLFAGRLWDGKNAAQTGAAPPKTTVEVHMTLLSIETVCRAEGRKRSVRRVSGILKSKHRRREGQSRAAVVPIEASPFKSRVAQRELAPPKRRPAPASPSQCRSLTGLAKQIL